MSTINYLLVIKRMFIEINKYTNELDDLRIQKNSSLNMYNDQVDWAKSLLSALYDLFNLTIRCIYFEFKSAIK